MEVFSSSASCFCKLALVKNTDQGRRFTSTVAGVQVVTVYCVISKQTDRKKRSAVDQLTPLSSLHLKFVAFFFLNQCSGTEKDGKTNTSSREGLKSQRKSVCVCVSHM